MDTIDQRITQVCNDREHGSRFLVHEALSIIVDLATSPASSPSDQLQRIHEAAHTLAEARPAMAALQNAMERVLAAAGDIAVVAAMAKQLLTEYDHATARIAQQARPLLGGILMTLSISGTVLGVLVACRSQLEQVIVLEGRPGYEGREMARSLAKQGIAVTLITDAQADIFLPRCHAVVVGADTVLANGDVLNKAGTALLAWAARGHSIPFYVLCESLKISSRSWSGEMAQLEEKEAQEVLEEAIPGVTVHNYYFDRTPASLITAILTERGVTEES
jgi:ribose 1,5-bisphosphate isomerase